MSINCAEYRASQKSVTDFIILDSTQNLEQQIFSKVF